MYVCVCVCVCVRVTASWKSLLSMIQLMHTYILCLSRIKIFSFPEHYVFCQQLIHSYIHSSLAYFSLANDTMQTSKIQIMSAIKVRKRYKLCFLKKKRYNFLS